MRALPRAGIVWLVLGGVFYSAGAGVLNMKGLHIAPGFGAHEAWHFFVMAGSLCHFWFMLKYIMRVD
jgi:hemolysin III